MDLSHSERCQESGGWGGGDGEKSTILWTLDMAPYYPYERLDMCMYIYMLHDIHTSIHPSINPCIHPSIHPSIHKYIHAHMHTCMHACRLTDSQTARQPGSQADIHTYTHRHACMHPYIHPSIHTCWWTKDPFTAARTILALKQTISSSVPSLSDFHRVG